MNLDECKKYLIEEVRYQTELKEKFLWLGLTERRFKDALTEVDIPEFDLIAKVPRVEKGMQIELL